MVDSAGRRYLEAEALAISVSGFSEGGFKAELMERRCYGCVGCGRDARRGHVFVGGRALPVSAPGWGWNEIYNLLIAEEAMDLTGFGVDQ